MSLSDSYGIMCVHKYKYQEESDMKIEFLFSEIKDIEKLYRIDLVDNPFGGDECPSYTYIGKEYLLSTSIHFSTQSHLSSKLTATMLVTIPSSAKKRLVIAFSLMIFKKNIAPST